MQSTIVPHCLFSSVFALCFSALLVASSDRLTTHQSPPFTGAPPRQPATPNPETQNLVPHCLFSSPSTLLHFSSPSSDRLTSHHRRTATATHNRRPSSPPQASAAGAIVTRIASSPGVPRFRSPDPNRGSFPFQYGGDRVPDMRKLRSLFPVAMDGFWVLHLSQRGM